MTFRNVFIKTVPTIESRPTRAPGNGIPTVVLPYILLRGVRTQFEKSQLLKRVRITAGSESLDHPHYMQKWDGSFAL